ncbi:O-methylsterigmatocystin oxidoreductase [Ceratobasidium theobromae]|uniref:O-methylsterigmatocystin oxidoreductase n=1 Tax=Ceratobasidium theobromae TaxID=1582974 RepID=A0A5N5QGQ1_9AGAM|nr:O-methylsterigmatocystin oxidoreductase [Ceratobasidium theobromae]
MSALVALTVVTVLVAYKLNKDRQRPPPKLPPSPRSYPLIGNLLSIPQKYEYLAFMKLGEELGSNIISLRAFGTTIVVLNKREDVMNILEKRSAIYSDRTLPPMIAEPSLLDWETFAPLVRYGDRWRMYRRLMNPWLNKQATATYHDSQEQEARQFLRRLLSGYKDISTSEELEAEFHLTVASTLTRSIYGHEAKSTDDRYIVGARSLFVYLSKAALPSNYMVNAIPTLVYVPEWFPGAGWKREAREWRRRKEQIILDTYQLAKDHMGTNQNIIATSLKNHGLELGLSEAEADDYVRELAITLFAGGIDTTANTLLMFTFAMILFPDVQKKAQEELGAVIGNSRLPSIADWEQLNYTWRLMQEVLRWGPVTPIAFPHTSLEDDNYEGYDIPKGTLVIGNVWALTRDPEVYKDPETFNPDRFLDPSVPLSPVFGWGRRRCPGVFFAESSLFIVIATLLMGFNIGLAQDEHGNDIRPSLEMLNATVISPKPFKLKLTPRSAGHEELLRNVLTV